MEDIEKSNRAKRMQLAMTGYTMTWLSNKINVAVSTVHSFTCGQVPKADIALKLCNVLGIRLEWYINGEGKMRGHDHAYDQSVNSHDHKTVDASMSYDPSYVDAEREMAEKLSNKTSVDNENLSNLYEINPVNKELTYGKKEYVEPEDDVNVPSVDVEFVDDKLKTIGAVAYDTKLVDQLTYSRSEIKGIRNFGKAMFPTLSDDSDVLFGPILDDLKDGKLYVIYLKTGAVVRRVFKGANNMFKAVCDNVNAKGSIDYINRESIIGEVVWASHKL